MLPEGSIDSLTRLVLINALYLKVKVCKTMQVSRIIFVAAIKTAILMVRN